MSKSKTAARSSAVSKKSAPAVSGKRPSAAAAPTIVTLNGKPVGPTPPPPSSNGGGKPSKAIDPTDCTLKHTELAVVAGQVSFAAKGGGSTAWHGYGQEILDTDTMEEVAKKAGLEFTVHSTPVLYTDAQGKQQEFKGQRVNFRTDTGAPLGVVSDQFKNVQPAAVLDFFREFCRKNKLAMETAGALRGGKTIWAMAKLGKDLAFMLPGGDKIDSYLRLQTAFDGTRATDAVATAVRQVCKNTENMINAQGNAYRVPHTSMFDAQALQGALGLLGEQHRITAEFWNELVKRKVSKAERDQYFCDLFSIEAVADLQKTDAVGKPLVSAQVKTMLQQLTEAFDRSPGANLKSAQGTAYGLLQAVTYWTDHQSRSSDVHGDGKDRARLNSAWFGLGARTKADAQFLAAKLAGCEQLVAA